MLNFKSISYYYVGLIVLWGSISVNASEFSVRDLTQQEKQVMQDKGVWTEECPVSLDRLQVIEFSYLYLQKDHEDPKEVRDSWYSKEIKKNDGKIVVLDAAADHVCDLFKCLYKSGFTIHKAAPLEYYGGKDEDSMADNNTSCFNWREITGGGLSSIHGYGLAIDVDPVQNLFVEWIEDGNGNRTGMAKVSPTSGTYYMNRDNVRPGMITKDVVELFKSHGFPVWGGRWNFPIDYQHFQTSRTIAQLLVVMNRDEAKKLFHLYAQDSDILAKADAGNNIFVSLYEDAPAKFMELLGVNPDFLKMDSEHARAFANTNR